MSWREFVKGMMRLADEQLFSDMKAWRAANPPDEVKHEIVIGIDIDWRPKEVMPEDYYAF